MEKIKKVFSTIDTGWLIRHYLFAIIFVVFFANIGALKLNIFNILGWGISMIFYPFAMFIYEQIVRFIVGDHFFILPIKWMFVWKVVRMFVILTLSIPIGLIGFAYFYYKINQE